MSSFDEATAAVLAEGVDDDSNVAEAAVVVAEVDAEDDDRGHDVESMVHDDDDEITTVKTELTAEDEVSVASKRASSPSSKRHKKSPPRSKKTRSPAVKGLTIPFRNVKRTMKLDPDIGTVQNEAAIMTTVAAELFIKSLAKESYQNAKSRGRGTIR